MNGIFEFDQARALNKSGHKVIYASIDLRSIRRRRKLGLMDFLYDGIQIVQLSIPLGNIPQKIFDKIGTRALRYLYRKVKKKYGSPDIVHAHFLDNGVLAADLCSDSTMPPLVITEHSSEMNKEKIENSLLKRAIKAYCNADRLIAVSNKFCDTIYKNTGIKPQCVHNIVDVDIFSNSKKQNNNSEFTFIATGNLTKEKGFESLIKNFNLLHKKINNINLIIIGGGPERANLLKLVDEFNLQTNITFKGVLERREIAELYRSSDAFVLPSLGETFGVVYIEAMAAGLPVIATKCGGPEDFVTKETGVLINVNNDKQLYEAMYSMIKNIDKFNRKYISEYAKEKFSSESISNQLTGIYREVLNEFYGEDNKI